MPGPTWLTTDDVVNWLRAAPIAVDIELTILTWCTASAEPYVLRYRPDGFDDDVVCTDAEVYLAALMVAGRTYVRRMSPAGVEAFTATTAWISSVDQEINRMLRIPAGTGIPKIDRPRVVTPYIVDLEAL